MLFPYIFSLHAKQIHVLLLSTEEMYDALVKCMFQRWEMAQQYSHSEVFALETDLSNQARQLAVQLTLAGK